MSAKQQKITFSFGKNWKEYLGQVDEGMIERAGEDLRAFLPEERVAGRDVIDIGCGSGVHSLNLHRMGAHRLHSFDYDPHSVEATMSLWKSEGSPQSWTVEHRSILDTEFVQSLGRFDIVYSWGVLHHTGAMWEAIGNATDMVKPGGDFLIALYKAGRKYPRHLRQKIRYNKASDWGKRLIVWQHIAYLMAARLLIQRKNPFKWAENKERGMNVYFDIIDWYGGLPYEVADEDEILQFMPARSFHLERIEVRWEGSCNTYLFNRTAGTV